MTEYYCPLCKKTMQRDSTKLRHKSYCATAGKTVYMIRMDDYLKLTDKDEA